MKKILLLTITLIVFSLLIIYFGLSGALTKTKHYIKLSELNYYHGVIVDSNYFPIDSVKICLLNTNNHTFTNKDGYFKLEKDTIKESDSLIINKKDFDEIILPTYFFYRSDYKTSKTYFFSRKEIDTIYLK